LYVFQSIFILETNAVSQAHARASPKTYFKYRKERTMAENGSASGLGWFLAGLGVGALVGVLYAPKSGDETRADLLQGASDAKAKAADYAQQGADKANQYVEQGKQYANDYADKGKQAASDYVDKGKEYYEKGRSQWTEYVEKGKNIVQDAVSAAVDAGKDAYSSKTQEVAG
jgi:gas vesicle protein